MKPILSYIFPTILCLNILCSCVAESIKDEVDSAVNSKNGAIEIKSAQYKEGSLTLQIMNSAPNTSLQIDSIEICNIMLKNENTGLEATGNIMLLQNQSGTLYGYGATLLTPAAKAAVQTFTLWSPSTLPHNSTGMYIKIYGNMYTYIADGALFLLCEGPMYFTTKGSITENRTTELTFEIADNCPLYSQYNGRMTKVLQSINFDVTVEDWE
ncbi:MAG: hypothetical protein IJ383_07625 [Bacteroidales bacterium]|nr:hypothetical protein [Bacteroidales bacterium]